MSDDVYFGGFSALKLKQNKKDHKNSPPKHIFWSKWKKKYIWHNLKPLGCTNKGQIRCTLSLFYSVSTSL